MVACETGYEVDRMSRCPMIIASRKGSGSGEIPREEIEKPLESLRRSVVR
jgi:hypothetical protein